METWNELTVKVNTEDTERAAAICTMAADMGIYIEDYSDIEQEVWNIAHVDLIEQELLERDRSHSLIHVYIKQESQAAEAAAFLDERLNAEGIEHETSVVGVNEEDWANKGDEECCQNGEDEEENGKDLGNLGKLGIHCSALVLAEERIGTARYGTGKTG